MFLILYMSLIMLLLHLFISPIDRNFVYPPILSIPTQHLEIIYNNSNPSTMSDNNTNHSTKLIINFPGF